MEWEGRHQVEKKRLRNTIANTVLPDSRLKPVLIKHILLADQ